MATPPAAICPICRAYGSQLRPIVKPAPDSRYASLTSSWSASAARCSDPPWTKGGGMVIAPSSSMAREPLCPILLPSRTRSVNRRSSGRGVLSRRSAPRAVFISLQGIATVPEPVPCIGGRDRLYGFLDGRINGLSRARLGRSLRAVGRPEVRLGLVQADLHG